MFELLHEENCRSYSLETWSVTEHGSDHKHSGSHCARHCQTHFSSPASTQTQEGRQTDKQPDRRIDRQADRQTGSHTERWQIDRHMKGHGNFRMVIVHTVTWHYNYGHTVQQTVTVASFAALHSGNSFSSTSPSSNLSGSIDIYTTLEKLVSNSTGD